MSLKRKSCLKRYLKTSLIGQKDFHHDNNQAWHPHHLKHINRQSLRFQLQTENLFQEQLWSSVWYTRFVTRVVYELDHIGFTVVQFWKTPSKPIWPDGWVVFRIVPNLLFVRIVRYDTDIGLSRNFEPNRTAWIKYSHNILWIKPWNSHNWNCIWFFITLNCTNEIWQLRNWIFRVLF